MMFFWRVADKEYPCPLVLSPTGQFFSPTQPRAFPAYFISPSHLMDPVESATRLSEIRVNKNYDPVIEAIKSIYPHVKSVSPEIIGGQPAIWAGIEGIEKELPLPVISSGIAKFVSIALLVQHPGALLIIDEIENSFYFGDYEPILNGIVYFCTKNEVQLVASTHSYEFLEAVAKVMRGRESDFSLLHSVRGKNGECSLSVMPGLSSRNTIEQQIELR
jgi:hypothetical protein